MACELPTTARRRCEWSCPDLAARPPARVGSLKASTVGAGWPHASNPVSPSWIFPPRPDFAVKAGRVRTFTPSASTAHRSAPTTMCYPLRKPGSIRHPSTHPRPVVAGGPIRSIGVPPQHAAYPPPTTSPTPRIGHCSPSPVTPPSPLVPL